MFLNVLLKHGLIFAGRAKAQDERDVALRQRNTIDEEVVLLSSSAGSLAAALSELTSFIADDTCPVCDRNFTETGWLR